MEKKEIKTYTFQEMIKILEKRLTNDLSRLTNENDKKEKYLKNRNTNNAYGASYIISLIFTTLLIAGFAGLTIGSTYQSYLSITTNSLTNPTNEAIVKCFLWLISAIGSGLTGVACTYKSRDIFKSLCTFLEKIIVGTDEVVIERSKNRAIKTIEKNHENLPVIQNKLRSLEEAIEEFKYLIPKELHKKTFTENDIDLLYCNMSGTNLPALLYLLYNDKNDSITQMTPFETENLTAELKFKIQQVKAHINEKQAKIPNNEEKRHRRMERIHGYPSEEMMTEVYSDIKISNTAHKKR